MIIPQHFRHIRATPFWDKTSVPQALSERHNTAAGVYGRLSVMQGAVRYFGFAHQYDDTPEREQIIEAGCFAISPPQYWHRIELLTDDTYFNLDFFAEPQQK